MVTAALTWRVRVLSVAARKSKVWHCTRNARSSNGNSGTSSSWQWKTNASWQAGWRCRRGMCVFVCVCVCVCVCLLQVIYLAVSTLASIAFAIYLLLVVWLSVLCLYLFQVKSSNLLVDHWLLRVVLARLWVVLRVVCVCAQKIGSV